MWNFIKKNILGIDSSNTAGNTGAAFRPQQNKPVNTSAAAPRNTAPAVPTPTPSWQNTVNKSNQAQLAQLKARQQNTAATANWMGMLMQNAQPTPAQPTRPASPANPAKLGGMWANNIASAPAVDEKLTTGKKVYAPSGNAVEIGSQQELAAGGEGIVYECPINKNCLIKIYKPATRQDKAKMQMIHERIKAMCKIEAMKNCAAFAWPIFPVYADAHRKEFIGFVMRKCSGKSLAMMRSAAQVQNFFPHWDRKSLALAALDFVKKVHLLASNGILINDFNPSNFLLDKDCKVYFIDCDSYQITEKNGKVHTTSTYFASHVAPELLKDKNALLRPRNIHHVQFGTALIVFNILMFGLHPYSYHDPNHKSACADPETNLRKGRCPLGVGSGCLLPVGNWYALWSWLIHDLKSSFIATFQQGHNDPAQRAGLNNLISVLDKQILTMELNPEYCKLVQTTVKPKDRKKNSRSASSFAGNRTFF